MQQKVASYAIVGCSLDSPYL